MAVNDPFGFQAAINWDVVDDNLDEIADILGEHCGYCGDDSLVLNHNGLCSLCQAREDREDFAREQDAIEHARLYGDINDVLTAGGL